MLASSIGSEHRDGAIRVDSETHGIVAVCLEGDFDLANAPELRDHIDRALESGDDLIVDLTDATFIDSSVISVLFDGARTVDGQGQTFVVQVATAPIVERALGLVRIESVVRRVHSRTEAFDLIRRQQAAT